MIGKEKHRLLDNNDTDWSPIPISTLELHLDNLICVNKYLLNEKIWFCGINLPNIEYLVLN